ncbi:unnamed protein product [Rotaria sp. Silwood1]|nr:unnamed protein product [Rotaria sp. Silwood1]
MVYLAFILLITLFTTHIATDARSIKQGVVDRLINDPKNVDDSRSVALANYRHRIEQSSKLKALRWALQNKYKAPEYCEACDILVSVPGSPKLTALHLSDIHVDFGYQPGSQAECFQPVCCRFGQPLPSQTGAGFWGDYRGCDLPYWTAEAIVQYIAADIDFVYFTGDLPPHNVWNQSRADQIYTINTINQLLVNTFPNKTFYSAVGNHEAAPSNLFPTPIISRENISWLYEVLADSWIKLGLSADTRNSILRGAFYATVIHPGLRLVSLNMNYCASDNYWLFINMTDPLGQLQWLVKWLQYAEDHEEKVHIIAHHPPRFCLAAFSWNFNRIVNREGD